MVSSRALTLCYFMENCLLLLGAKKIYGKNLPCINFVIDLRRCKNTFGFEKYLIKLPLNNRILMTKFRCRNHRLPIEAGCRAQTTVMPPLQRHRWWIPLSVMLSGIQRRAYKYINVKFWKRPSAIKLEKLFKQNNNKVLKLSLFMKVIIPKF